MSLETIVRPYCQKVLPLVYDDSLSYYEVLCKLRAKINEVIETFNDYEDVIAELQEAITDIADMKTDIASLQGDMAIVKSTLTTYGENIDTLIEAVQKNKDDIATLQAKVTTIEGNVESQLATFMTKVEAMINSITFDADEKIQLLAYKINQIKLNVYARVAELEERMDSLDTSVLNPWWQELGRLSQDKNNKKIYYDLADNVLTAEEYCKLGYTADEYDAFHINARTYARFGKQKLHWFWVYSPTFGWRQETSNVLTSIMNGIWSTIDAKHYSNLGMTAREYSDLDMTAFEYYRYNTSTVGLYEMNNILQSEDYKLEVDENGILSCSNATLSMDEDGVFYIT